MQHDHVLNKLTFDHRVRGAGRGDLGLKYLHVSVFAILFHLNKLNFDLKPHTQGLEGRKKVCRQNICCHVSEFENLFNLI